MSDFLETYNAGVEQRAKEGIPPLPLSVEETREVVALLQQIPDGMEEVLLELIRERVSPGVDPAARVKSDFLTALATGEAECRAIKPAGAIELLGTMIGGYNLDGLLALLGGTDETLAVLASEQLKKLVLAVNCFDKVKELAGNHNVHAQGVLESWAEAEWFASQELVPAEIETVVYKVDGEINTDDFSPAAFAFTRADIPLHANCMGGSLFPDGPEEIARLKREHQVPVAFVGDVVGTGSSRKSACNSLIWHIGNDIPFVPNKRRGGIVLGGIIAPIFFNTAEDSGALPIQCDVSRLSTGQIIRVLPAAGEIRSADDELLCSYEIQPSTILDEYRAGGRVPLIIGKQLTEKARQALGKSPVVESGIFAVPHTTSPEVNQGYTLAQKLVGQACGEDGILPGTACLPKMSTVGSQDTTGPMTASEMTELACLHFNADLVMQSFCHTAAYPKPGDVEMHASLPGFISERGGVSLKPGDGVIHSWLNRLLVPDQVGTGGDSHTRFPLGISFPAGSGLVAFAAALGVMPLDMPESVLVKLKGVLQPGITLRDVVNYIPLKAIREGLLTVEKQNKQNAFSGRILEIEGLPDLSVEQAFELTDSAAERSAAAATIRLNRKPVVEFLKSNISLMESMIEDGYQDAETLRRRIAAVEEWISTGELVTRDENAHFAEVLDVDLGQLSEPVLACPNDPDDVRVLSDVAGAPIDEVFVGSCMTNISHFRRAAEILRDQGQAKSRLWICPPTRMDQEKLRREGLYAIFTAAGARLEIPGCSLCMGNQARVRDGAAVFSTSTRNFNNRMGKDANVYLGSAELAAISALLGRIPTVEEYIEILERSGGGVE